MMETGLAPEPPPVERGGKVSRWVRAHVAWLRSMGKVKFIAWVTVEKFLVSLPIAFLISLIWEGGMRSDLRDGLTRWEIFNVVILAPFIETLLFQALPMGMARGLGAGRRVQLVAGAVPFATLHFLVSWHAGWGVMASGFYNAFTYMRWREQSYWTAVGMTTLLHAVHNGLLVLLGLALGAFEYSPPG